jgi:hypothetical protein
MMIYAYQKKSKPKLRPKKERDEYQAWLDKHGVGKKTKTVESPSFSYNLNVPVGRSDSRHIPSLNSGEGNTNMQTKKVYTGNKMLGIGTLHKSNAVPVFSQEEALDMAKMRR